MLGEAAGGPFEHVVERRGTREACTGPPLEIADARQVDAGQRRLEPVRGTPLGAERLDAVDERRLAAVEPGAGVPDVERRRRPAQRSVQRRKAVLVHARERTREGAREIVSALEQMERAGEVAVPGEV